MAAVAGGDESGGGGGAATSLVEVEVEARAFTLSLLIEISSAAPLLSLSLCFFHCAAGLVSKKEHATVVAHSLKQSNVIKSSTRHRSQLHLTP